MSNDIVHLDESAQKILIALDRLTEQSERTEERLATGKKVNKVTDDPVVYFAAKDLSDRAVDFSHYKDDIDQALSSVNVALDAVESVEALIDQQIALIDSARTQNAIGRQASTQAFKELGNQIAKLTNDASYQGVNILNNTLSSLDVRLGTYSTSYLEIDGRNLTTSQAVANSQISAGGLFTDAGVYAASQIEGRVQLISNIHLDGGVVEFGGFSVYGENGSLISRAAELTQIFEQAVDRLRATAQSLADSVNVLETRLEFTEDYVNILETGADKLVLADINEEAANLTTLQTRYDIGIQTLAISGEQQQAVLTIVK